MDSNFTERNSDDIINSISENTLHSEPSDVLDDVLSRMPDELKEVKEYDTSLAEIQQKRRLRRKKKRLKPLGIFIIICVVAAILASPIFAVKEFKTNVSENYTKEELLNSLGFKEGMNIFRAKFFSGNRKLRENPYIENGKISISLPDTVIITVEERKVRGSIFVNNSYLYIDQNGRVLAIDEKADKNSPIIKGIKFSDYSEGLLLDIENPSSLSAAVSVSQLIEKYDLSLYTIHLDVTDINNITAKINNAEILLGSTIRLDEKIRNLAAIMPYITADAMGTLDLSDMDSQITFKYLT